MIDKQQLRELAERAIEKPEHYSNGFFMASAEMGKFRQATAPAIMLELLDEIERAESKLAKYRDALQEIATWENADGENVGLSVAMIAQEALRGGRVGVQA